MVLVAKSLEKNPNVGSLLRDPLFSSYYPTFEEYFETHRYFLNSQFGLDIDKDRALTSFLNYVVEPFVTALRSLGPSNISFAYFYFRAVNVWRNLKNAISLEEFPVTPDQAIKVVLLREGMVPWWKKILWNFQLRKISKRVNIDNI
jgi:hypothetical protein